MRALQQVFIGITVVTCFVLLVLYKSVWSLDLLFYSKSTYIERVHSSFYDASLFKKHLISSKNRTIVPDICVTFLSCKRIHHLRKAIRAIIMYFDKFESNIVYEIAVLDNGSGPEMVNEILSDFPIDIIILRRENVGIAAGLNVLFHGACRSPFILSLEEDWEAGIFEWSSHIPVMAMSMHVLMSDPTVLEIWLRDWPNDPTMFRNFSKWLVAPPRSDIMNGRRIMYRKMGRTPDSKLGSYTNGASLKHRKRLSRVGYMGISRGKTIINFNGELQYSSRVFDSGLTAAHLCLPTLHPDMNCHLIKRADEPKMMQGLFAHLGVDGRSPGHLDHKRKNLTIKKFISRILTSARIEMNGYDHQDQHRPS